MVMWGSPGPAADLSILMSGQGLSGPVAIEPRLGHLVFQLLELKVPERFGDAGLSSIPLKTAYRSVAALYSESKASHSMQRIGIISSLVIDEIVMATVRFFFLRGLLTPDRAHDCRIYQAKGQKRPGLTSI